MGIKATMNNLIRLYALNRQLGFADRDIKRAFERSCIPSNVCEIIEMLQKQQVEIEDLKAYKSLSIELANRKGFDSVAQALDFIDVNYPPVEAAIVYNMLCDLWPKNNKPLDLVIREKLDECTQEQ